MRPGRNSGANEWSAFGAIGNLDFNAMGREMWVRYPAFELDSACKTETVIEPGQLESFRLGLVNNRLPAIWGGWQHGGLLYKVSVMTVPSPNAATSICTSWKFRIRPTSRCRANCLSQSTARPTCTCSTACSAVWAKTCF